MYCEVLYIFQCLLSIIAVILIGTCLSYFVTRYPTNLGNQLTTVHLVTELLYIASDVQHEIMHDTPNNLLQMISRTVFVYGFVMNYLCFFTVSLVRMRTIVKPLGVINKRTVATLIISENVFLVLCCSVYLYRELLESKDPGKNEWFVHWIGWILLAGVLNPLLIVIDLWSIWKLKQDTETSNHRIRERSSVTLLLIAIPYQIMVMCPSVLYHSAIWFGWPNEPYYHCTGKTLFVASKIINASVYILRCENMNNWIRELLVKLCRVFVNSQVASS